MKTPRMLATLLLLMLLLSGCQSSAGLARSLPTTPEDNTAELIADPQFKAAAQAAPEWVKKALATITRLETEKADQP